MGIWMNKGAIQTNNRTHEAPVTAALYNKHFHQVRRGRLVNQSGRRMGLGREVGEWNSASVGFRKGCKSNTLFLDDHPFFHCIELSNGVKSYRGLSARDARSENLLMTTAQAKRSCLLDQARRRQLGPWPSRLFTNEV